MQWLWIICPLLSPGHPQWCCMPKIYYFVRNVYDTMQWNKTIQNTLRKMLFFSKIIFVSHSKFTEYIITSHWSGVIKCLHFVFAASVYGIPFMLSDFCSSLQNCYCCTLGLWNKVSTCMDKCNEWHLHDLDPRSRLWYWLTNVFVLEITWESIIQTLQSVIHWTSFSPD